MDVDDVGGLGMGAPDSKFPSIVTLNVGGSFFTVSLETLRNSPFGGGSMLSAMFSGRIPTFKDGDGRFFIDRDGRHFHFLLNYLRDGTLPVRLPTAERAEVAKEASYYGIEALEAHLRSDLQASPRSSHATVGRVSSGRFTGAADAADMVLNRCLEDWPEFSSYVQSVLSRLLQAAGAGPCAEEANEPHFLLSDVNEAAQVESTSSGAESPAKGVLLDAATAASLQAQRLAEVQVELAHLDENSKVWRWSERKHGVNSVLRAKLLRLHLQRLGYMCTILPVKDKAEIVAYVLQVELPLPAI